MLRSGEREIQSVMPLDFHVDGTWSCSTCGRDFHATSSRIVHYRHADGREFRFIVCRDCGDELRPYRVVIDLDRLEQEIELDWLRRRVEQIARQRRMQDVRRLTLRSADVHQLAAEARTAPVTLVEALAQRRVAQPFEPHG